MSRARGWFRRVSLAAAGASGAALVASVFEGMWARAAGGDIGVGFGASFLACFGLVGPIALVTGLVTGLFTVWISPGRHLSLSGGLGALRQAAQGRQAEVASFLPLAVLAAFVWATTSAHLGRAVLSLPIGPGLAGITLAAGSALLGLIAGLFAFVLLPHLRTLLARAADRNEWAVDPTVTLVAGVVIAGALFAIGVATGTVSGEGGYLGIWGIFKRSELDLRAPAEIVCFVAGGLFASSFFAPPATVPLRAKIVAAVFVVAPLAFLVVSAGLLNRDTGTAQGIERGAPIAAKVLKVARGLTDRDGDGASGLFGGGDCNDRDPAIGPFADEIVDNGVDEDCSGADLTKSSLAKLAPSAHVSKVKDDLFPADLNVVLITVDTLRWDLGFMGNPRKVSPNLDALAARSTVFEKAYSLASYTGKSIGPMLIGKYGSETNRNWGHFNKFSAKDTFLAERLEAAGMFTAAVHGHRYFDEGSGLERGFEVNDFSAAPPKDAPWDIDTRRTSEGLSDAAIRILADPANEKRRFFLWVHYLDPHADYLPHPEYEFGSKARDLYDGEVAFTDHHIGRVLEAIDKASWGKRTAIIVSSDHGEAFGENNMHRHGFEVWETLVRVPLIVHVPSAKPSRVSVRRSLIDLVPTVLELSRVDAPKGEDGSTDFISGVSLLPDLFSPDKIEAREILVDMPGGPYNDARRALIDGNEKLIVSNETKFALYDLEADPGETTNLAGRDEARLKAMKERYAARKALLREVRVTGKRK